MEIFWRLLLAHMLGDFTLQTNRIAVWKRESVWGMLAHSSIFLIAGYVFTWNYLNDTWFSFRSVELHGWECIVIITVLHFLEDQWRVYSIQKFGMPDNLALFLWDQFIHISLIYVFSPVHVSVFLNPWPIIGVLAIMATHFMAILVFYIEMDAKKGNGALHKVRKHWTMAVRLVLMAMCLLPGISWFLVLPVAGFTGYFFQYKKQNYGLIDTVLGNGIAVVCGITTRLLLKW
ncbi:MAG: DUF3307 domain-containing protein [Elusimicrobiota bacterium]